MTKFKTDLMSTVALFKLQMICFIVYIFLKFTYFLRRLYLLYLTWYTYPRRRAASFDKYVCYFSAILVKYMQ